MDNIMTKNVVYNYGAIFVGYSLKPIEIAKLEQLLNDSLESNSIGAVQNIYDFLLEVLPSPNGFHYAYRQVHTWIKGAKEVNSGDGAFAAYIRSYTEIQYESRFGVVDKNLLNDQINRASNEIGRTLAKSIISNNGALPDIEGIGAVDGGESARMLFENDEHYPIGDYTGWAGTILFPFLGYDKFYRDWLLSVEDVDARIYGGPSAFVNRSPKEHTGLYDLFAALHANQETIRKYSIYDKMSALFSTTLDGNQEKLIEDTTSFVKSHYKLPGNSVFEAGNVLPYTSTLAYLTNDIEVRVGSLNNDNMADYWQPGRKHYMVHAGKGDDVIYAPNMFSARGQALIDGGEGRDTLMLASRSDALHIKISTIEEHGVVFEANTTAHIKNKNFNFQLSAYSIDHVIGTAGSDWLTFSPNLITNRNITVNLAAPGIHGNTLDLSKYSTTLNVTAGSMSFGGSKNGIINLSGVQNIVGTRQNDTITGDWNNNIIDAGPGVNNLRGREGNDTFVIGSESSTNYINDSDPGDRLVLRMPNPAGDAMLELKGGFIFRNTVMHEKFTLQSGDTAWFHPVKPTDFNYRPDIGSPWPALIEQLGKDFQVRYKLAGSDLRIDVTNGNKTSTTIVRDFQQGDMGLEFFYIGQPNQNVASAQFSKQTYIDKFEQAHTDMFKTWAPPPLLHDVWSQLA